jgi:hypothetical protein
LLTTTFFRSRKDSRFAENNNMKTIIKRFPFTLAMLGVLTLAAFLTNTHSGQLSAAWLNRFGFAPTDLLVLDLWRLFTSAVVTSGGVVFWEALGMITFAVGLAEWRTSSCRAALTFWGVHLLTLLIESFVVALPLHWAGINAGSLVALSRDVGPSAGYFGAMGLAVATLRKPWHWIVGGAIFVGFIIALMTISGKDSLGMELSADLAHLLAFPLGWLSLQVGRRTSVMS